MSDGRRHARIPLALVISRYFLYALIGVLFSVGVPLGVFTWQLETGAVLEANYGETRLQEVEGVLAVQERFDADVIPSAYRYARFDADGALLESDMSDAQLAVARALAASLDAAVLGREDAGSQPFYAVVVLPDGGACVLSYDLMPQWADKGRRDALPNPQDLLVWTALFSLVLVVALAALRAGRVFTREMGGLIRAAEAIGKQDLDTPVGSSGVAEVDDVLRSVEAMRVSLKESIEAREQIERQGREQVAALAHDLKTPLTVALGNAELLAEDAAAGRLGAEQAACARAIGDAARSMDAFVGRIVEASRGTTDALHLAPTDPLVLADRLAGSAEELVTAHGLSFKVMRTAGFEDACGAASPDGSPLPCWDADALERAVLNLVGNACDHTEHGSVTLSFSCTDRLFSLSVADEGTGFSPDALGHATERFYRGDASRSSRAGGSHFGLGLTIAADIAAAHGGRLELSNRTDDGGRVLGARAALLIPLSLP